MTRESRAATGLAEVMIGFAAVVPLLVDQATTDTSATAWLAMAGYSAVVVAALTVRNRWPLGVFCTIFAMLACAEVTAAAVGVDLTDLAVLPPAFALYAVGAHCTRRHAMAALLVAVVLVSLGLLVNHATAEPDRRGGAEVLAFVSALPIAWALGVAARGRRELLAATRRQAEAARQEQALRAEQAAAAERVRIARDMHDVVAHSLTLLVVHAETVRARSGELPPWARERIDALAAAGRQATSEMRDLLGVLRDGNTPAAPRAPAPTLAQIAGLVQAAEAAGTPVSFTTTGAPISLPRPVQLAGYRIVQETLANARRHAPGAGVRIRLDAAPHEVILEVSSGPPPGRIDPVPGSGIGLPALRERVTALGGDLTASPGHDGGFQVTATIPYTLEGDHHGHG